MWRGETEALPCLLAKKRTGVISTKLVGRALGISSDAGCNVCNRKGDCLPTACNVYQTCLLKVSFKAISSAVCLLLQTSAGGTEPGQDFC